MFSGETLASAKGAVPRRHTAKELSAAAASHWTTPRPVLRVLGEKASHWLRSPNPSLEAAQTDQGYQEVEGVLVRIEHGVPG